MVAAATGNKSPPHQPWYKGNRRVPRTDVLSPSLEMQPSGIAISRTTHHPSSQLGWNSHKNIFFLHGVNEKTKNLNRLSDISDSSHTSATSSTSTTNNPDLDKDNDNKSYSNSDSDEFSNDQLCKIDEEELSDKTNQLVPESPKNRRNLLQRACAAYN